MQIKSTAPRSRTTSSVTAHTGHLSTGYELLRASWPIGRTGGPGETAASCVCGHELNSCQAHAPQWPSISGTWCSSSFRGCRTVAHTYIGFDHCRDEVETRRRVKIQARWRLASRLHLVESCVIHTCNKFLHNQPLRHEPHLNCRWWRRDFVIAFC